MVKDVRYALRTLAGSPGFTAVALATLACGIGANTVLFSAVNAVLFEPLPYRDSERIVQIVDTLDRRNEVASSVPKFDYFRDHVKSVHPMAALANAGFQMTSEGGEPAQLSGARVSGEFFNVFGVSPVLGRAFLPAEDLPGGANVAVISYSLWQTRFGGDRGVIGRSIGLDGASATIVGVMPSGFNVPDAADVWTPRVFESAVLTRVQIDHGAGFLLYYARLSPGVDERQALAEFETLAQQYNASHAGFGDIGHGVMVRSMREGIVSNVRGTLLVLWGTVGFVLLIAAANVANLLLARAISRRKEIAIRASLGASRSRLLAQFLTESVILSVAGAILGILIAEWGVRLLTHLNSRVLPRAGEIQIDGRVLLFTVVIAIATGVLFGLGPALHSLRMDLNRALKESGRGISSGGRLRGFMVVAEVSLAMMLLAGAGLLMRSFANLEKVDPGFRPQHLLSLVLPLAPASHPTPVSQSAFFDQVLARVSTLPGVEKATLNSVPPIAGGYGVAYIYSVDGRPPVEPSKRPVAFLRAIDQNYFDAMRIPLIKGRQFKDADSMDSPRVVIINQTMARHQWPNEDPIGRRFSFSREQVMVEVVGVVADVKFSSLDDKTAYDEMYLPYRQRPVLRMSLLVRGTGDVSNLASSIRHEIAAIDASQPITNVETMEEALSDSVARPRLQTMLMGAFAALALLLATIGIFGVVAWWVSQRTNEIGIRIALGATPGSVFGMIVGSAFRTIGIGQAIGLIGGLALTRLLGSALFGVSADDPMTFAVGAMVLAASAFLSCAIAARRAIRIDPVIALRQE